MGVETHRKYINLSFKKLSNVRLQLNKKYLLKTNTSYVSLAIINLQKIAITKMHNWAPSTMYIINMCFTYFIDIIRYREQH